jgi:hypothetical protein
MSFNIFIYTLFTFLVFIADLKKQTNSLLAQGLLITSARWLRVFVLFIFVVALLRLVVNGTPVVHFNEGLC